MEESHGTCWVLVNLGRAIAAVVNVARDHIRHLVPAAAAVWFADVLRAVLVPRKVPGSAVGGQLVHGLNERMVLAARRVGERWNMQARACGCAGVHDGSAVEAAATLAVAYTVAR